MKKLLSKVGYFIKIKETIPNGPNFCLSCADPPLPTLFVLESLHKLRLHFLAFDLVPTPTNLHFLCSKFSISLTHAAHPLMTSSVSIYGFPNFDDFDEKLMAATTLKVA